MRFVRLAVCLRLCETSFTRCLRLNPVYTKTWRSSSMGECRGGGWPFLAKPASAMGEGMVSLVSGGLWSLFKVCGLSAICVSDSGRVDVWGSRERRLSLNSFEPYLFGCRPSALKRYLRPQNKLKLSIKPLPLSLQTLESHVFSASRRLNLFIPLSTAGMGPLMNDLMCI